MNSKQSWHDKYLSLLEEEEREEKRTDEIEDDDTEDKVDIDDFDVSTAAPKEKAVPKSYFDHSNYEKKESPENSTNVTDNDEEKEDNVESKKEKVAEFKDESDEPYNDTDDPLGELIDTISAKFRLDKHKHRLRWMIENFLHENELEITPINGLTNKNGEV